MLSRVSASSSISCSRRVAMLFPSLFLCADRPSIQIPNGFLSDSALVLLACSITKTLPLQTYVSRSDQIQYHDDIYRTPEANETMSCRIAFFAHSACDGPAKPHVGTGGTYCHVPETPVHESTSINPSSGTDATLRIQQNDHSSFCD